MEPFGAFFETKCTPYLEARQKARSGVKGLSYMQMGQWLGRGLQVVLGRGNC